MVQYEFPQKIVTLLLSLLPDDNYKVSQSDIYTIVDLCLREWIPQSNNVSKARPDVRDGVINPFRAKHINDVCMSRIWQGYDIRDVNILVSHKGMTLETSIY